MILTIPYLRETLRDLHKCFGVKPRIVYSQLDICFYADRVLNEKNPTWGDGDALDAMDAWRNDFHRGELFRVSSGLLSEHPKALQVLQVFCEAIGEDPAKGVYLVRA